MKKLIQEQLQAWLENQDSRFYGGVYVMDDECVSTKNPDIIGINFEESCNDMDEWDWGYMEELKEKIENGIREEAGILVDMPQAIDKAKRDGIIPL